LIAGGAVVALGAAGAVELGSGRRARLLHRLGLENSPDRSAPPSHTPLVSGALVSAHMPAPVKWMMSVPAGTLAGVVYCLHGRGADQRFAFEHVHLPDFAAAAGARLAFAAVEGGEDSYWHHRADGRDPLTMLLTEFIPMIESRISARDRALLGWSMGGYGALLAAETAPDRFRAVCVVSPALWTSASGAAPGSFDGAADYRRNDVFTRTDRLRSMVVRIDCGDGDEFSSASKRFAHLLHPAPEGTFGAGFHDTAYWRSVAPAQIATISRAFAQ
jgi:S-formylglutathione hydrolase FrmB